MPADRPSSERWARIEALLREALECPVPERAALLDERCSDDEALRAEVEALLAADEETGPFLEDPAALRAADLLAAEIDPALLHVDDPAPGENDLVGPYRLGRELGRGGMGVVYEAVDSRLGRRVALKFLPARLGRNLQARERFLREARAASALDHPGICTIHDIGESGGQTFIVMSYCEGASLSQRLEAGPLPPEQVRDVAIQLADALRSAHGAGVIHRDVKPSNVILGDDGKATLLDFGIAKMGSDATLTQTGQSLGTPAYMSPEQLRGENVDQRTDLWSLGALLYEMLTGRKPFNGESYQAVSHAILHRPIDPASIASESSARNLALSIGRLLAKNPEERYQSAAELLSDLNTDTAPRRAVGHAAWRNKKWRNKKLALGGTALLILLAMAAWWITCSATSGSTRDTNLAERSGSETVGLVRAGGEATVLAVLFFQNLSGDQELDWLRQGLPDMLITDLAQSPGLQVVSTGRLRQLLESLGALEQTSQDLALTQALAERAAVEAVVRGSYVRLGDQVRVTFTLEEAVSGEILDSDRFEGRGTESLFQLVDELAAAVRNNFELQLPPQAPATVEMVTTSSLEAWRYFTEAKELHSQSKRREAIALLEKAVEIDPDFALAFASLGRLQRSLGQGAQAREATAHAVRLADRLPVNERFLIEADFFTSTWATYDRGIESYREAVETYPENRVLRGNLAHHLASTERYDEALEQYEALFIARDQHPGNYVTAANVYGALDRFETGYRLLADFAADHPDNWFPRLGLGWLLTEWGRLEEADEAFDQAAALRPGELFVDYGRWRVAILSGDLDRADREADRLAAAKGDAFANWRSAISMARNALYRGDSETALTQFERATVDQPGADAALARCWKAQLHLDRGEPRAALDEAERAIEQSRGQWPELEGMFVAALASQQLGDRASADRIVEEIRSRAASNPNPIQERRLLTLSGRLALARGDLSGAVSTLRAAVEHLPPRGAEFHFHVYPDHVPLWVDLARAELAAGDPKAASHWLEKAANSGAEHLEQPIPYVRSLYLLGQRSFDAGDAPAAERYLGRFLSHWEDGDLDRAEVAAALDLRSELQHP